MSYRKETDRQIGWIWSPKLDFLIFGLPLASGLAVVFFISAFEIDLEGETLFSVLFYLLVVVFADKGHNYSTFFRVYLDPQYTRARPLLFYVLPIVVFATVVFLHGVNSQMYWVLFLYLNLFHLVRQQVGLVNISNRRIGVGKLEVYLDRWAIHLLGFLPILYFSANQKPLSLIPFATGLIIGLPGWIADVSQYLFVAVVAIYLGYFAFSYLYRSEKFGLGKIYYICLTILMFGSLFFSNGPLYFGVLIMFGHSIPYICLIIKEGGQRWRWSEGFRNWLFEKKAGILVTLIILGIVSWIERGLWADLGYEKSYGVHLSLLTDASPMLKNILVGVISTPVLSHFIFDGFIWKSNLVQALKRSTP